MQMQTDQINVRIDTTTKIAAETVFSQLGLSATDAIRMFYRQVAMRQGLPFEPRIIAPEVAKKDRTAMQERIGNSVKRNKKTLDILANR